MSDIVSIDPLNLVAPLILAALGAAWEFFIRPKLHLKENIDLVRCMDDYYLRLRVQNTGLRAATGCIGRMVEIRKEDGTRLWNDQLDFCWERQSNNTGNPPGPITISRKPDVFHLDLAQYTTGDSAHLHLRVNAHNQQLSFGQYNHDFCHLAIPIGTYFVLITIRANQWFVRPKKWYVLQWTGSQYVVKRYKRWRRLWRWK